MKVKVVVRFVLFLAFFLACAGKSSANLRSLGYLDGINSEGVAFGWALDPDTVGPIDIHFYIDAPAGSGTLIGVLSSNLPRPDVNLMTGHTGNHGFNFKIPSQHWDGMEHLLYAYAIDSDGGVNPNLKNSPQSFLLGRTIYGTGDIQIEVIGSPEMVFDYSKDRCEDLDIPDTPARAFRDMDGQVNLIASHHQNYRMLGDSLNTVKRDCNKIMSSTENPDFEAFSFAEWITAPYTLDGQTIYALVHNEWYGFLADPKCKQEERTSGWINAITFAISYNGGVSFSRPSCDNIVIRTTLGWDQSFGCSPANPTIFGALNPSNIFKKDDFFYAFFQSEKDPRNTLKWGSCLMRASRIDKASAWQVWTKKGWRYSLEAVCEPIDREHIEKMHESVTWNTYLQAYVLIGGKYSPSRGVYFSTSKDLIHWTTAIKFLPASVIFPVLLDPDSATRNFETSGQEGYIYYTRFNQGFSLDRDLLRQKIKFIK